MAQMQLAMSGEDRTVDGLLAHIQRQNRRINLLEHAVERSSQTVQAHAMRQAAEFLHGHFGSAFEEGVWSDEEAGKVYDRLVSASSCVNREA